MRRHHQYPCRIILLLFSFAVLYASSHAADEQAVVSKAVQYILNNQSSNGVWSADRQGIQFRDTAFIIEVLAELGMEDRSQFALAVDYALRYKPRSTEFLARKTIALEAAGFSGSSLCTDLLAQRQDYPFPVNDGENHALQYGGWPVNKGFLLSDPMDTALALQALTQAGAGIDKYPEEFAKALAYLSATQQADGGWAWPGGSEHIALTAEIARALKPLASSSQIAANAFNGAVNFMLSKMNGDGGFGDGGTSNALDSAYATLVLKLGGLSTNDAVAYLATGQDNDGSFAGGDAFVTALVVLTIGGEDVDSDNDGIADYQDNCPGIYNPDQLDNEPAEGGGPDGIGDPCDPDDDNDGIPDEGGPPSTDHLIVEDLENAITDISLVFESTALIAFYPTATGQSFGYIALDSGNYIDSGTDAAGENSPFAIVVDANVQPCNCITVEEDATIALTYDGGQQIVAHLPEITPQQGETMLFVADDGATYYDINLTQLAQAARAEVGDNCQFTYNPDQTDTNGDGIGDACENLQGPRARLLPETLATVNLQQGQKRFYVIFLQNKGNDTLTYTVTDLATSGGSARVIWEDDVETGKGSWTHGFLAGDSVNFHDDWQISDQRPDSGSYSWYSGPEQPDQSLVEGFGVTVLVSPNLASPDYDISLLREANLEIDHLYNFGLSGESSYADGAIVEISIDGGSQYYILTPEGGYDGTVAALGGDYKGFAGSSNDEYRRSVFFLDRYLEDADQMRFRFTLAMDNIVTEPPAEGWHIDDIRLLEPVTGGDATWLEVIANYNSLEPDDSDSLTLLFDAAGLQPGTYAANVIIQNNDLQNNPLVLPVVLNVTAANTPTATPTGAITSTPTEAVEVSPTPTATPSASQVVTETATATPSPSGTEPIEATPTSTVTVTGTQEAEATHTPTPSSTLQPVVTAVVCDFNQDGTFCGMDWFFLGILFDSDILPPSSGGDADLDDSGKIDMLDILELYRMDRLDIDLHYFVPTATETSPATSTATATDTRLYTATSTEPPEQTPTVTETPSSTASRGPTSTPSATHTISTEPKVFTLRGTVVDTSGSPLAGKIVFLGVTPGSGSLTGYGEPMRSTNAGGEFNFGVLTAYPGAEFNLQIMGLDSSKKTYTYEDIVGSELVVTVVDDRGS